MSDPAPHPATALSGDPFDALVRAHYGRLCNFAYRFVRSQDAAEDIVQDVLTRMWRRREAFTVRDPLPYLYQAVRNQSASYRRQERVRERWRDRVRLDSETLARDDEGGIGTSDLRDAVARAVDALPERCRLIFTMSREQDLSYADIARALNISIKTVETQMGRALRQLRTRLADYLVLAVVIDATRRWLA